MVGEKYERMHGGGHRGDEPFLDAPQDVPPYERSFSYVAISQQEEFEFGSR
jgi:hypothetical protein